jgi:hypothetical protein
MAIKEGFLPGTESMKCAMGLYRGSREFIDGPFKGTKVWGVFSNVDISDSPCERPVRVWCLWDDHQDGKRAWLACDDPAHRQGAEAVVRLDGPRGDEYIAFLRSQQGSYKAGDIFRNKARRNPALDVKPKLLMAKFAEESSNKKPMPRNKGNRARKRVQKLLGSFVPDTDKRK